VLEFNPRTNAFAPRGKAGFTARHSLGAAAVQTSTGPRIYAIGGYASTDPASAPVGNVEEFDPVADKWRTVASLPTPVSQFGITVTGGINTAEPLQLIHVVSGNTGTEVAPSVANANPVQRYQADPAGPGTWSAFTLAITLRRNLGAATALRGVQSRVFVIGGQDAAGTVLDTVEEYLGQGVTIVSSPHTSIVNSLLSSPRARFGIASSLSTNQIYVIGGMDQLGADQSTILEYTINNNGTVAGPAGTPSGSWVSRGNLSVARNGLQVSSPPGVVNLLPVKSTGRSANADALAAFVASRIRPAKAPVTSKDAAAKRGQKLFGTAGLVLADISCATCHGGPKWTRSSVDFAPPPSPEIGLGFGNERVIGAELRQTKTQMSVLNDVGTFTAAAGRQNEIRFNGADISQAIAPLGANGFNIPSLLSLHETAPYFYNGLAQTLDQVLDGSQDNNGGSRVHFISDAAKRADLIQFLKSIDEKTKTFK
jgi:mono/diheme cytochrome c family protein